MPNPTEPIMTYVNHVLRLDVLLQCNLFVSFDTTEHAVVVLAYCCCSLWFLSFDLIFHGHSQVTVRQT